jgi:hypothetical protein
MDRMSKRRRSGNIGPGMATLLEQHKEDWFTLDPNQSGACILQEDLMPHFAKAGLADAAVSNKTKRKSWTRRLHGLGYKAQGTGGQGNNKFALGARWEFPPAAATAQQIAVDVERIAAVQPLAAAQQIAVDVERIAAVQQITADMESIAADMERIAAAVERIAAAVGRELGVRAACD